MIAKGKLLAGSRTKLDSRIKKIESLRNDVAHANNYGQNQQKANEVCVVVRDIYDLKQNIQAEIAGTL